jgi:hypothetical protein
LAREAWPEDFFCLFRARFSSSSFVVSSERGTDKTFFRASENVAYSLRSFLPEGSERCKVLSVIVEVYHGYDEGSQMPKAEITIKVRAREDFVPVESLITIISNTLSILKSLGRRIPGHAPGGAQWKISAASLQSPLSLTLASDDPNSDFLAREYLGTLDAIENSAEISKDRISFFVLERAKHLVSVLNDGVSQVSFSLPNSNPVHPTQRVAANVDYLTAPAYEDYSTFEGKIEMLSVHGRPVFRIYDELTGQSISCFFPADHLDEAHDLFNKRVAVSGNARYSRMGRPISIRVEAIRPLHGGITLEQLKDINITGGVSSEAYVRKQRDAE